MPKCPKGKILRSAYKRKAYTRADGTRVKAVHVKAGCVPDKGKPGKTPAKAKVLPKPTPGALSKYGYYNVKRTLAAARHKELTKAVKDAGYATIIRRVNLVANYNKLSDPRTHKVMRSDIAWMQKNLAPLYSKTAKRASKRVSKRVSKRTSKPTTKKLVKAGSKTVGKRKRQIYHISGSTKKFYKYRRSDGTMGRRYI